MASEMKCNQCKFWTVGKECQGYEENNQWGECSEILGSLSEVTLQTGMGGGYVKSIETDGLFFCKSFQQKPTANQLRASNESRK
ncbi:hypothetical protein NVP1111B_48 [Vibrio phage 1.111.B._10N.286.45.E6]|nr:hypothetical protein NVP1111A_48 [Vibrio phage 1.111.A._10N.286.45.E6]AUR88304.1 hypothetical protein NVP1111B_48 [Vibrio phage 1.111.B._10N.286.45.E6]